MIQRVFGDELSSIDMGVLCFSGFKDANKLRTMQFHDRNAADLRSTGNPTNSFPCLMKKNMTLKSMKSVFHGPQFLALPRLT